MKIRTFVMLKLNLLWHLTLKLFVRIYLAKGRKEEGMTENYNNIYDVKTETAMALNLKIACMNIFSQRE